jgi:outer membrane biogenesis lipoprotein LolB
MLWKSLVSLSVLAILTAGCAEAKIQKKTNFTSRTSIFQKKVKKEKPYTSGLCTYLLKYRVRYRPETQDDQTEVEAAAQEIYFNKHCR